MSDVMTHIHEVCERTGVEFWSEPFNAITSLGYLFVAWHVYTYRKHRKELEGKWIWDIHVLNVLIAIIGISSFLFHSLSTGWAEYTDITTIASFIVIYFFSCMIRVVKCNWLQIAVSFMAFLGMTHLFVSLFPGALNDSIGYLSSMAVLCVVALYLNMKNRPSARMFLTAALLGCISLFFRGIDRFTCDYTYIGTHFIWHSLNCVLLYILMKQIIRNVNRRDRMLRKANMHHS